MRIWNLGDDELIVLDIAEETLLNEADKKKAQSLQDKALGRERDQKIIKEKSLRLFWKKKYEGDIGLLLETSERKSLYCFWLSASASTFWLLTKNALAQATSSVSHLYVLASSLMY